MAINIDLNDVIADLLEQNKSLTLENIILRKALEQADKDVAPTQAASEEFDI